MANDMLMAAKREADALRSALAKNPDYLKLQQVQRLIAVYEAYDLEPVPDLMAPSGDQPAAANISVPASPRPGSKVAQIDDVVSKYLAAKGSRASSGDILPVVVNAGVELGGVVPSKTLSSFLSNSKRFNNVKGLGYGLLEWGDTAGPAAENSRGRPRTLWNDPFRKDEAPFGDSK
jgi:hypothetical protein